MRAKLLVMVAASLALGACGRAPAPQSRAPAPQSGAFGAAAPSRAGLPGAIDGADAQFLSAAAMYENYQIEAARIAAAQGRSPSVRAYAMAAGQAHRRALDSLSQVAQASGAALAPSQLNDNYRAYLARLGQQDAIPFDIRYASQQSLLTMSIAGRYDAFASTAPSSPLRTWATAQSQTIHDEINEARQMASAAAAH